MWPIKGHHKKCHTDQGRKMTLAGLPWHVAAAREKKKKSKEMLPPHQTCHLCPWDRDFRGSMWTSPLQGGPDPTKHEALPEEFLLSLLSGSRTAVLTSSSMFDVHGNPAKAACHLLRTFVKVVKQPWQQTHRRQQQQKGACNAPWICFIKCSLI